MTFFGCLRRGNRDVEGMFQIVIAVGIMICQRNGSSQLFQCIIFPFNNGNGLALAFFIQILGFLFAKYVLKLSLLNNLGSITGGMTSTPALGTLIGTAGTEDVASAYAATYPVALISVVLVSQFLIILFS